VFTVSGAVTAVDQPAVPTAYALGQNTPNPFNPQTIIRFDLPAASRTVLKIFDAKGRVVRTLVSEDMPAGFHEVIWRGEDDNGNKVASGVYYYQIQAADYSARKSMVMLK